MKKLVCAGLVICLMAAMSLTVYAGSTTRTGTTSGGLYGTANTSAALNVTAYMASGTTSTYGTLTNITYGTTVTITYLNYLGHTESKSGSGTSSAGVSVTNAMNVLSAVSQHTVNGGSYWGTWNCTITGQP